MHNISQMNNNDKRGAMVEVYKPNSPQSIQKRAKLVVQAVGERKISPKEGLKILKNNRS